MLILQWGIFNTDLHVLGLKPIYYYGFHCLLIEFFRFDGYGDWLQNVSKVGDPALTFVFYFPLIFALNALSGVKFLGAIILSEWINLNLKW